MLLELVDRVFVINLPSRQDRRSETIEELTLTFGREAIQAKVEFLSAVRPTDAGNFDSVGVRGAMESHLLALRTARDRGLSCVMVLEDDVEFTASQAALDEAGAMLASSSVWGYCSLGHLRDLYSTTPPPHALSAVTRELGGDFAIEPDGGIVEVQGDRVRFVRMRGGHIGAHCLIYRASVYDALIDHLEACCAAPRGSDIVGPITIDGALNTFTWINPTVRLVAEPSLADQRSSLSDISPHWADRSALFRPLSQGVRSLKRRLV